MTKQPQAFIFDLDGVITDTAEYHFLAWHKLATNLKIPFPKEFNEELKGISRMESLEKILLYGGRQQDFSKAEKEGLAAEKNQHYLKLIEKITPNDILPGIQPLIQDIKANGLKLALASASKNAFSVMEALRLKDDFDIIVDAKKVKKGKPDPEVFLTAAKLLNVDATACIGIEDAVAGVDAIKAAGMFAVAVGQTDSFKKADLVVATTDQLSFENILKHYQS